MTSKELRRLSRRDLLELLIHEQRENEELQTRVATLERERKERLISIEKAGSLAEAALVLNGIFANADKAVEQYIENIQRCSEEQQSIYDKIVFEAERKAQEILDSAEKEKQQKIQAADEYWKNLCMKLEEFYQSHVGLRELLLAQSGKKTSGNR